ncbi:MAG: SDR family NAD(P)-dependent oxidoreductase, partial [Candidatus Zipacnadales bacterium]
MSYLDDMFGLRGKVAVVVGGGGVLGGAMSLALARAGARVAIVDLDLEKAQGRAQDIVQWGGSAIALRADASQKGDLEAAAQSVEQTLHRVDVLVNAAGINSATPFFDITEQEWDTILNVNLKSIFLTCQIFGKRMIARGEGGSIINISSASSGPPLS